MSFMDDYTSAFSLSEDKEYTTADFRAMVAEFRDVVNRYDTEFSDMKAKLDKALSDNAQLNDYNRNLFNKITSKVNEESEEPEEIKYDDYEAIVDEIVPRKEN